MKLKRLFHQDKLIFNKRDEKGGLQDPFKMEGAVIHILPGAVRTVQVKTVGALGSRLVLSPPFIERAVLEGWMVMDGRKIVITCEDRVLVFSVTRNPGRYCSHCDEKMPYEPENAPNQGHLSRLHVAENHLGMKSPDPESPAGYNKTNAFVLRREE